MMDDMIAATKAITPDQYESMLRELALLQEENKEQKRRIEQLEVLEEDLYELLTPTTESIPRIDGIDIGWAYHAFEGKVGGDVIGFLNFPFRYDLKEYITAARKQGNERTAQNLLKLYDTGGIAIFDVTGHGLAAARKAAVLYKEFICHAERDLQEAGEVTSKTFNELNMRQCKPKGARNLAHMRDAKAYPTGIYGEVTKDWEFRYMRAGHLLPIVFSNRHDRIENIYEDPSSTYFNLGLFPIDTHPNKAKFEGLLIKGYQFQQPGRIKIYGNLDMIILPSDGVFDTKSDHDDQSMKGLERTISAAKYASAEVIADEIKNYALRRGQKDDISVVVIKFGQ